MYHLNLIKKIQFKSIDADTHKITTRNTELEAITYAKDL